MKKIFIISTFLLLTACLEQKPQELKEPKFKWAVVDNKMIENKLREIAKEQNPYQSEYNISQQDLRNKVSELSRETSRIRRVLFEECFPQKKGSTIKSGSKQIMISGYNDPLKPEQRDKYSQCKKKTAENPEVEKLEKERKHLENLRRLQSKHDKKISELAKKTVNIIIQEYSKDKFEVVINKSRNNIAFNKNGLTVDITDAIAQQIQKTPPTISLSRTIPSNEPIIKN